MPEQPVRLAVANAPGERPHAPWQQPEKDHVALPDEIFPPVRRITVVDGADAIQRELDLEAREPALGAQIDQLLEQLRALLERAAEALLLRAHPAHDRVALALELGKRADGGDGKLVLDIERDSPVRGFAAGAGLILGGEVYRPGSMRAGEFGHQTIDVAGPTCDCGRRGCLELLCLDAVRDGNLERAANLLGIGLAWLGLSEALVPAMFAIGIAVAGLLLLGAWAVLWFGRTSVVALVGGVIFVEMCLRLFSVSNAVTVYGLRPDDVIAAHYRGPFVAYYMRGADLARLVARRFRRANRRRVERYERYERYAEARRSNDRTAQGTQ